MLRVEQRERFRPDDHPDGPQRGDCMRACYASLLGMPLEAVPEMEGYNGEYAKWIASTLPGVEVVHRMLGESWKGVETLDSWRDWPTEHHEFGYWIAGVYSYRIPDEEVYGCGCVERISGGDPDCQWCHGKPDERLLDIAWGLHAVVMRNGECVWDPHPERDKGFGPFRSATTFALRDPEPYSLLLRWPQHEAVKWEEEAEDAPDSPQSSPSLEPVGGNI